MSGRDEKAGGTVRLKWGSLKGWDFAGNEAAMAALQRYHDQPVTLGVAQRVDTPDQKQAIFDMCDAVEAAGGTIVNDWSGERMSAAEAKRYVAEYRA